MTGPINRDCSLPWRAALHVAAMLMAGSATSGPAAAAGTTGTQALERGFHALEREGFSGQVVVLKGDRLLASKAAGRADRSRPFRTDTKVDIASISKPVTALAFFKLVEQGRASPDDTLAKWFPEAPADKRAITLRQLLTHSSGLVDIPPGMTDYARIDQATMQRRIFAEPLEFTPGSKDSYCNSGYNLIGMIVEKASGEPFFNFLEREIFRPAGIAANYDPAAFPAAMVASWPADAPNPTPVRSVAAASRGPFWGLWGAGGIYMSARDEARLFRAFWNGKLVRPATVTAMTRPQVKAGNYAHEAMGWTIIHTDRGDDFISYTGGSDHSGAALRYYPRDDITIATAANSSSPGAVRAAREFASLVVGDDFAPLVPPPGTPPLSAADPRDLAILGGFIGAVAAPDPQRRAYIARHFTPRFIASSGVSKLSERIANLAALGSPRLFSVARQGGQLIIIAGSQESEYPRLYRLVFDLTGSRDAPLFDNYTIKRV